MQLRGVDVNLVVALRALLEERHVTRAAKKVGLGQSAMSHALSRLRAHFGDPLLVQVGRKMVLTEKAKSLLEPVQTAVMELERVFATADPFEPETSTRTFRVAATDNLELYVLPKLFELLGQEAPHVSLRVHHLTPDWPEALRNGDIDLKLGRESHVGSGLRCEDLFEERYACVVAKEHPVTTERLTLAEYAKLRHLVIAPTAGYADSVSTFIDARLGEQSKRRHIALSVSHFVVAPLIVAKTDLALTAAERLIRPFVKPFRLRLLELPFRPASYRLTQIWADRSHDDSGHAWFRAMIQRAARPFDGLPHAKVGP
jgi:DNA-binding transcriptional LysR family regulator